MRPISFFETLGVGIRRFGETVLSFCLMSALLVLIDRNSHLQDTLAVDELINLLVLAVFLVITTILMRRCRFVLGGDMSSYLLSNVIAWVLFTGCHLGALALDNGEVVLSKCVFRLIRLGEMAGLGVWTTAIAFDLLLLALIFLSQIGMGPILKEAESELNARYD